MADIARKGLRMLAWLAGMSTSYHVAARFQSPHGVCTVSMTCRLSPWLHQDNYHHLVQYVADQAQGAINTPCITSVTRLGP